MTDWYARCAYDPEVRQRFHTAARARLRRLATTLGFRPGSFDLRSNLGGIAVSGEITLHHDDVYIQVCQPASGADSGILIRTCQGRRDYTGGGNHLARSACSTMRRTWQRRCAQSWRRRPARFPQHRPRAERRPDIADASVRHARRWAMISAIGPNKRAPAAP